MNEQHNVSVTRRRFMREGLWGACLAGLAAAVGFAARKSRGREWVWQIDPYKCIACGHCATRCVLEESAVKCTHQFAICGYCKICFGFFQPEPTAINEGAENQMCPTGALQRKFIEDPYFQYTIDETLCNGCGKCVKGCNAFGNGSLFLQIHHDRCLNCNQCSIAAACPAQAFQRVPADHPYLLKSADHA
jgi:electron transport complex protein RnfB